MQSIRKTGGRISSDISSFFLKIFFPKRCVGCGSYDTFLCSDCAKKIVPHLTPTCLNCGKLTEFGQYCSSCKHKLRTSLAGIITAADYRSGPTKEIIHHLKYSGFTELSDVLGELICQRLKAKLPSKNLIIVPVPLYQKREAERGYNQSELIARYVSKRLDIGGGTALEKSKNTVSQVKLTGEGRRSNLKGVFCCVDTELIAGKDVLLIDDVTTTGSTLEECASVLKMAGARKVWGVVVASAKD